MPNPNKDQQEIPGAERPSDRKLDEFCYHMMLAQAAQHAAKETFEDWRAKAIHYMGTNKIEIYLYRDGDRRFALEYEENETVKFNYQPSWWKSDWTEARATASVAALLKTFRDRVGWLRLEPGGIAISVLVTDKHMMNDDVRGAVRTALESVR